MDTSLSVDVAKCFKLNSLEEVYNKLKNNSIEDTIHWKENVINCLTNIAVQIYDVDFNESYKTIVEKQSYALRCLVISQVDLTGDFYEKFLDSLCAIVKSLNPSLITSSAYKILDKYIRISHNDKEKLLILNSLMICFTKSTVNFEIFEHFPPSEWRKELLMYSLFMECEGDVDALQHILTKTNESTIRNDTKRTLEDILEVLICNHNSTGFNIHFLNDVFFLISRKPKLKEMLFDNFPGVLDEIRIFKKTMMSTYFCIEIQTLNNQIPDFNYFCEYPLHVIEILMTKISGNLEELINFKQLLECSKKDLHSKIKLILKLNPKESLLKWKFDIAFAIVKDIITIVFPAYENSQQQNNICKNVNIASTFTVCCTCYNSECWFHKSNQCCDLLYALNSSMAKLILGCCDILHQVSELVESLLSKLKKDESIIQLINALNILEDYEVKITYSNMQEIFSLISIDNFEQQIHKYAIRKSFPGSYEKSVDQLLNEIEELSPGVTTSIIEMFDKVQHCYKYSSNLLPNEGPVKSWDEKKIRMWAQLARLPELKPSDEEILAVIKTAARITVNLQLRDIQIISILLMINSNIGKGRLCQISTGEGKTIIIAALAAYNVYKGHTVDVYTSSPVLAIPQFKEYENFYTVLNLTATHNIDCWSNYNSDVIYGTNSSFQRDVLCDEFRKTGVRKSREFDVAIVDEVDNMLMDGNNWILLLSCDMPAMDYLEVLLAAIYIQVNAAAQSLIDRDGRTYYLVKETAIDHNGNVKPEIFVEEIEIEGSKRDFIIKCTETHLRKLIRDTEHCKDIEENYPVIKIPKHLREVICTVQLRKWISNAVDAVFLYVKDEDYILKDDKVIIVDADNTGSMKLNSKWSNGLHQFLEIKHGARVHPESFTTNFLSNVGLFTRYVSKLFGLTGTLGSKETKIFLQTTYDVDFVVIPPFKLKQHRHLKPILVNSSANKYSEIAISCIRKLKHGQAALIIMKYIRETKELADVFIKRFNYDSIKVKIVNTDDDSEILEKPLQPGEVIITTNIAGRGTDVKLTKGVEENGGLHVCLTFLPLNSRVEHQNIGRTSRKGNRGTSQLVVSDPQNFDEIEKLKEIRNRREAQIISRASQTVEKVKTKDRIFRKFCKILDEISGRNNDTKETDQSAAEERFAIWLILNDNKLDCNSDDIYEIFNEFKQEILNDDHNDSLIKNPCMYIRLGNNYLIKTQYDQAIFEYDSAIILDHNFSEFAYYNRARAYLCKYGQNISKHKHFIDQAMRDLNKTRKLIVEKEYSLHLLQTASKGEVFSEQVNHKLNVYNLIKNTIELAIGPDIDAINDQIIKLEEELNKENLSPDVTSKMNEMLKNLREHKTEIGTIGRAKYKNRNIEVSSLGDDFIPNADLKTHNLELQEFKCNGWLEGFKVTEIKPIDWMSVISLLGIGLGQLLIGAALTVFTLGAGAHLGMGLISEGVSDIITAIKEGVMNRTFDWENWALMKVISIAVSVVCAGFKAIKDAAKTAYAGAKTVISANAKVLTQTTKEGWKLVATKMGLDMAKGVAKEIVTDLVAHGIDKMVLPMIEEIIVEQVREPIQQSLLNNSKVAAMLKLDLKSDNHAYENKIRGIAEKILSPEEYSKLKTIATTIATRVADSKGFSFTRQACTGLVGVYEITTFTTSFTNKLNQEIDSINVDSNVDEGDVGQPNEKQLDETFNQVQCDTAYKDTEKDIDLSKAGKPVEQIKLERKPRTTDRLSNEIAGMVSKNILQILRGKIVMPVVSMGANYSIDKVSSRVTECLDRELQNYRSKKNVIHHQNRAYANNIKDLNETFTANEIKKVDLIIDELTKGGPAGLVHLGAISTATDRPIEVYNKKGRLKYTIGDTKKSNPIQVQYETENGSDVGHFTLKGHKEPFQKSNSENMCLFNVIAEQTGQKPDELKNKTLHILKNNKNTVAKQIKHIIYLEMYDKSSLLQGGAQYDGTCPDHAKQYLISSNGVRGFRNKVPGHADKHIPFKGKTIDKLNCIAEESERQIEVYDKIGKLSYVVGEKTDKDPIKLQYYKPEGDTSAECFSALGGNERYFVHNPNDMNLYNIVSKQTGLDASSLKTSIWNRIDAMKIPSSKTCVENELEKTGFVSFEEQSFVLDCALKTEAAQLAMNELNEYKSGVKDSKQYWRKELRISEKELNLSRPAYGGKWENGKLKLTWPVRDIFLLLHHSNGNQENPKAPVHIQTFFPYSPDKPPRPPP